MTSVSASPFGAHLRQWRLVRNLSQLELASRAGSTPRHISFLETGRSRPSRATVLHLAEVLGIPPREHNHLLRGAGFAPSRPAAPIDPPHLAAFTTAVERLLSTHEPFPALVLDPYSEVVAANRASERLLGPNLLGDNLIERLVVDRAARDLILNWPEIACALLTRLRVQLDRAPLDSRLRALLDRTAPAVADLPLPEHTGAHHPLPCPAFRLGGNVIHTIQLSTRFDTASDLALDEMRVELFHPLDPTAEQFFRNPAPAPER
ncbi:helix-turn-helix domain-containing protein [Nocardia sp. NPDC006044]|uniref:helix-turn-helix domain-containing protein n=1 Tax=Nocardia sp. NPDC006044 TaxID=3364306 RepID=UPI00369AD36F